MNREQTFKFLRNICNYYKVKVIFRHFKANCDGECYQDGKTISVNKNQPKKDIATTVYHELAHALCIREGRWLDFHLGEDFPIEDSFYIENQVEWIAKKLWDKDGMRRFFGQFKFYYTKKDKKEVLKWISENYS